MSKLPALKSRDIIRAIEKAGFIEHWQKGSHKIFKKGNLRITVQEFIEIANDFSNPLDIVRETFCTVIEVDVGSDESARKGFL